jgi:CubicO group peptidase (beta-lactamase class C family)
MAKFGYLYLNDGQWNGKQLIPTNYIRETTTKQNNVGPPVNLPYGYLWWVTQHENHPAFLASGNGGRLIYIIPTLDLVVVTIASTEAARKNPIKRKKSNLSSPTSSSPPSPNCSNRA